MAKSPSIISRRQSGRADRAGIGNSRSDLSLAVPPSSQVPAWPGLILACCCTLIYFFIGTRGTFELHTSSFVHHTLTANAWLHGRLYATDDEVERAFLFHELEAAGRRTPSSTDTAALKAAYRSVFQARIEAMYRARGFSLRPEQLNRAFSQEMKRAYHDWVTLPSNPTHHLEYWPPVTAALMVPFVLIGGPQVSDVLADNLVGGATILVVYLLLRALSFVWSSLTTGTCILLSVAYGCGTVHMWLASLGQVWFLEQVTATFWLVIAAWLGIVAIRRPAFIMGSAVALSLGYLARFPIILSTPFFLVIIGIFVRGRINPFKRFATWAGAFLLVVAFAISFHMYFNWARFGDPMDSGQTHLADNGGNPRFTADFKANGTLSFFFLQRNIFFYFLNPRMGPSFGLSFLGGHTHPSKDGQSFDPDGNGLFFVSPFMIYLWVAWRRRAGSPLRPQWLGPTLFFAFLALQVAVTSKYSGNELRWADRNEAIHIETAIFVILTLAFIVRCLLEKDELLLAVLAGAIPGVGAMMLFYGTGWYSFGPRYLLDSQPFLIMLVAFGMRGRVSKAGMLLVAMSIVVNVWGTYRFRLEQF